MLVRTQSLSDIDLIDFDAIDFDAIDFTNEYLGIDAVVRLRIHPSAKPTVLQYQETCLPSFIKISQFLLMLQLAQTGRQSPGFQLVSSS